MTEVPIDELRLSLTDGGFLKVCWDSPQGTLCYLGGKKWPDGLTIPSIPESPEWHRMHAQRMASIYERYLARQPVQDR